MAKNKKQTIAYAVAKFQKQFHVTSGATIYKFATLAGPLVVSHRAGAAGRVVCIGVPNPSITNMLSHEKERCALQENLCWDFSSIR